MFTFCSRETNVLRKKLRTTIERIRLPAENLLDEPQKQEPTLSRLYVTDEENDALLDGLITWFNEINYDEQIRLLTVAPPSWDRNKIASFFPCNRYQVERSIQIREWFGVLHKPVDLCGNSALDRQLAFEIVEFYERNGVSRSCSKKKDMMHVQKRLVAIRFMCMTVCEAYALFKQSLEERNSNASVGVSTFYSLRPKLIKIKTPHDVCACVYHENLNLLIKVSLLKMNMRKTIFSFRLGISLTEIRLIISIC